MSRTLSDLLNEYDPKRVIPFAAAKLTCALIRVINNVKNCGSEDCVDCNFDNMPEWKKAHIKKLRGENLL